MAKKKPARPLAAFDFDGTLVREQLLVLLTKQCLELGIFRPVFDVLFREVRLKHRDRIISFEQYDREIIQLFTHRIKGKMREDLVLAGRQVYDKHRDWLYVFTRTLLAELRKTHEMIAITGAMQEVVEHLAPYWGFEHYYATELETNEDGRYTGKDKSVPAYDKGKVLREHVAEHKSSLRGSVAIGDTGSDASMLEEVEFPIAFNPNGVLRKEAQRRGWPIVFERKDVICVLLGDTFRCFQSSDPAEALESVRYALDSARLEKRQKPEEG